MISSNDEYFYIGVFGSRNDITTFFKCKDNTIGVLCGCFRGTLDEFKDKVIETHGDSKYAKEYLLIIDAVRIKFS